MKWRRRKPIEDADGPAPEQDGGRRDSETAPPLPGSVDDLVQAVKRERQRERAVLSRIASVVIVFSACALLARYLPPYRDLGGWQILAEVALFLGIYAAARRHRKRIHVLAEMEDKRCAGLFAEALWLGDYDTLRAAGAALVRLLPQLQASDAGLLNSTQRACLNTALSFGTSGATRWSLRPGWVGVWRTSVLKFAALSDRTLRAEIEDYPFPGVDNTALRLAILTAFEQVGDAFSLPSVERLAAAGPGDRVSPSVVAKARECLPFLQARAEAAEPGRQLLRPSEKEPLAPDALPRAAAPARTDDLLRPGSPSVAGPAEVCAPNEQKA